MANFRALLLPGVTLLVFILSQETTGTTAGTQILPGYAQPVREAPVTEVNGRKCVSLEPSIHMSVVLNFLVKQYGKITSMSYDLIFDDNVVALHSGTSGREEVKKELGKLFSTGAQVKHDIISMHNEGRSVWALIHTVTRDPSMPNTETVEGNLWYFNFNCHRAIKTWSITPTGYYEERDIKKQEAFNLQYTG